ncbi:MAG: endonuclease domain-containing protein [Mycobacterium sp.]|uniref:endonuclease domain-containing protein n=1 Tax=Mycobacterium sp. TaxID=1785 RepID=UPI003F96D4F8
MDDIPFRGSHALKRRAVTRSELRTRYRAVFRDVYIAKDAELTAATKARAAWLSTRATLAGLSAAAVLGTKWLDGAAPAEIVRADRHGQRGMVVHSYELADDEVQTVGGMRVTTAARTAFDIGCGLPVAKAVPILDALLNATGIKPADVIALADRRPGARGIRRLRAALELADGGAESPQETRVRLLLVGAGLPKPETQIEFRDLRIRVDMGWREGKVAVEYDGVQHWENRYQRSWDIERIALLEAAGWSVIRVSAEMLSRPNAIVERVKAKLAERGAYGRIQGSSCP